jgi:hypothetical protein
MQTLTELQLIQNRMDAEGVAHLAGAPKLEYLKTGMKKKRKQ